MDHSTQVKNPSLRDDKLSPKMKCSKCTFETTETRLYNYHRIGHITGTIPGESYKPQKIAYTKSSQEPTKETKAEVFGRVPKEQKSSGLSNNGVNVNCVPDSADKNGELYGTTSRVEASTNALYIKPVTHAKVETFAVPDTKETGTNCNVNLTTSNNGIDTNKTAVTDTTSSGERDYNYRYNINRFIKVEENSSSLSPLENPKNSDEVPDMPDKFGVAATKIYTCMKCTFTTDNPKKLTIHMEDHSGKTLLQCRKCSYSTKSFENFTVHKNLHGDMDRLECPQCPFKTDKLGQLKRHAAIHGFVNNGINITVFKCAKCDYESRFKHHVTRHELTHLDVKLLKCTKCYFRTNNKVSLNRHLLNHIERSLFKCKDCSYSSNIKEDFKRHELRHLNTKLFCCQLCEYQTNRKFSLKEHMYEHQDIKLYECGACKYSTNAKGNLIKHEKTHFNHKTLHCKLCNYRTNRKDHLNLHMSSHIMAPYTKKDN